MQGYQEITTQEDMDQLLQTMSGFHDSMTKEIHMTNRGCILPDHNMAMGHQFDMQMLIQSQMPPYTVELVFINILELRVTGPHDYSEASGYVKRIKKITTPVEDVTIRMDFDGELQVSCRRLFFRVRENWLGRKVFLRSEVPSCDTVPAEAIEGRWRLCSNCLDAWEEEPDEVFSYCPRCGSLTELIIEKA